MGGREQHLPFSMCADHPIVNRFFSLYNKVQVFFMSVLQASPLTVLVHVGNRTFITLASHQYINFCQIGADIFTFPTERTLLVKEYPR